MILLVLVVAVFRKLVAPTLVLVIVVSIVTLTGTVVVASIITYHRVVGALIAVLAQLLELSLGLLFPYSSSSSL